MNSGEDKRFHYPDWQTHIRNVRIAENRLDVTEVQTITVDTGSFHHLYRTIPAKRAAVENATATFDGVALRNDPSQQPGTYNANLDGEFTYINVYLPQPIN